MFKLLRSWSHVLLFAIRTSLRHIHLGDLGVKTEVMPAGVVLQCQNGSLRDSLFWDWPELPQVVKPCAVLLKWAQRSSDGALQVLDGLNHEKSVFPGFTNTFLLFVLRRGWEGDDAVSSHLRFRGPSKDNRGCVSVTLTFFRLSPRPSHAGYDPKRTWGTLKFIIANDKSLKKIAFRQPIAVVA